MDTNATYVFRWDENADVWTYRGIAGGWAGARGIELQGCFLEYDRNEWWRLTRCQVEPGNSLIFGAVPEPTEDIVDWRVEINSATLTIFGAIARLNELGPTFQEVSAIGIANLEIDALFRRALDLIPALTPATLEDSLDSVLVSRRGQRISEGDRETIEGESGFVADRFKEVGGELADYPGGVLLGAAIGRLEEFVADELLELDSGLVKRHEDIASDLVCEMREAGVYCLNPAGEGERVMVTAFHGGRVIGCAISTRKEFLVPTAYRLRPHKLDVRPARAFQSAVNANAAALASQFGTYGPKRSEALRELALLWFEALSTRRAGLAAKEAQAVASTPQDQILSTAMVELWHGSAHMESSPYVGLGGLAIAWDEMLAATRSIDVANSSEGMFVVDDTELAQP